MIRKSERIAQAKESLAQVRAMKCFSSAALAY